MKKIAFALIGILCLVKVNSQTNTFPSTGSVGIGTTTPGAPLHLYGGPNSYIKIEGSGANTVSFVALTDGTSYGYLLKNSSAGTQNNANPGSLYTFVTTGYDFQHLEGTVPRFTIKSGGFVGIGTTNPLYSLQVNGAGASDPLSNIGASIAIRDNRSYNTAFVGGMIKFGGTYNSSNSITEFAGIRGAKSNTNDNDYDGQLEFFTRATIGVNSWTSAQRMIISSSGNVGIGVMAPGEKLCVSGNILANGNIKAKKVTVTQNGWSDYVFYDNYSLRSLAELEKFINKNKHLPDVPSAKDVEEKGINVGDTQALLLKKVEELTLYIIKIDKEKQGLISRLEEVERKIKRK